MIANKSADLVPLRAAQQFHPLFVGVLQVGGVLEMRERRARAVPAPRRRDSDASGSARDRRAPRPCTCDRDRARAPRWPGPSADTPPLPASAPARPAARRSSRSCATSRSDRGRMPSCACPARERDTSPPCRTCPSRGRAGRVPLRLAAMAGSFAGSAFSRMAMLRSRSCSASAKARCRRRMSARSASELASQMSFGPKPRLADAHGLAQILLAFAEVVALAQHAELDQRAGHESDHRARAPAAAGRAPRRNRRYASSSSPWCMSALPMEVRICARASGARSRASLDARRAFAQQIVHRHFVGLAVPGNAFVEEVDEERASRPRPVRARSRARRASIVRATMPPTSASDDEQRGGHGAAVPHRELAQPRQRAGSAGLDRLVRQKAADVGLQLGRRRITLLAVARPWP